jgi:predicted branched-subunit amino acid permease
MVTGTATLASSLVAMALTQGIINLRYCLMSCALSQKLAPSVSLWQRAIISFGVTDEIFAMSMAYKGNVQAPYSYGMMAISITGWSTGTALGAWAGQILPESCVTALGMALYAMFVAIVLPTTAEDRNVRRIVIVAALSSVVMTYVPCFNFLSSSWRVIFLTILLSALAAICFPLPEAPVNEKRGACHD